MSDKSHDMVQMALGQYRTQIDEADVEILEALAARFKATDTVGRLKKTEDLPIFVPEREQQLLGALKQLAVQYKLSPEFVESLWKLILEESKARQQAS